MIAISTRRLLPALVAAATLAVLGGFAATPLGAQNAPDGPVVQATNFDESDWPESVGVTALVAGVDDEIERIDFLYTVLPEGAITRTEAELQGGDVSRLSATIRTRDANIYIPAGADFEWAWEFLHADGTVTATEPQIWRYDDPRYEWRAIERGALSVWYYDRESLAEALAIEGAEAIEQIAELLSIEVEDPITVYIWRNPSDAVGVERIRSEGFEERVITGGTRVLADLVHIYDPTRWVIRHELTHVLTKIAGEGPFGDLPAWLDEGTATISEGDWLARRGPALQFAIANEQTLPLRSMESTSNIPGQVDIFYGQSAAIVTYLIDTYGREQFARLFAIFKVGSTVEDALQAAFGIGRDELDDAWRDSVGLPPRERGEDRSTEIEDDVISGPQIAGDDEDNQDDEEAEPVEASDDQAGQEEPQAQDEAADQDESDDPAEQSAAVEDDRDDNQVSERVAEIERRQRERRPAPIFDTDSEFPWAYVLIGVAGAVLLLSTVMFVRAVSRPA